MKLRVKRLLEGGYGECERFAINGERDRESTYNTFKSSLKQTIVSDADINVTKEDANSLEILFPHPKTGETAKASLFRWPSDCDKANKAVIAELEEKAKNNGLVLRKIDNHENQESQTAKDSDAPNYAAAPIPSKKPEVIEDSRRQSAVKDDNDLHFGGSIVKYPKGATQASLEKHIPGIQCMPYKGYINCIATVNGASNSLVRNVQCINSEIVFVLKNGRTEGMFCSISRDSAIDLYQQHTSKYGASEPDHTDIGGYAKQEIFTWIVKGESTKISHMKGRDIKGNALDAYTIFLGI